jgi:hypothetical protein
VKVGQSIGAAELLNQRVHVSEPLVGPARSQFRQFRLS